MKISMSTPQFILLFTYVIFIAHALAEPTENYEEDMKNHFLAWRQRFHEARANRTRQSSNVTRFNANEQYYLWSGAVHVAPPHADFNSVTGEWVVPVLGLPDYVNYKGEWGMAEWVGIDGWYNSDCPNSLFQAGIYSYIQTDASGLPAFIGYRAWYEWLPQPPVYLNDFPMYAGDPIKVTVTAQSSYQGTVDILNLITGKEGKFTLQSPGSDLLCGENVEWIMENGGGIGKLATFGTIFFSNCYATTYAGDLFTLDGANFVDYYENHLLFAVASQYTSTAVSVRYIPL